jgi:hypothetical protein
MTSEKKIPVALTRVLAGIILCVGLIAVVLWPAGSGDSGRPGQERAEVAKVADGKTSGGGDQAKPWTPGAENPSMVPSTPGTAGEVPAPSVPTPVLDAWLADNMDKGDAEFTSGLLAFAEDGKQPPEERAAALNHALNLLPDKDYSRLETLLGAKTTPVVMLRQVLANVHNRGERAAVWAAMALMAREEAEISGEGRELLAFLLDMDAASDISALKLQGETRLLEHDEAAATGATDKVPVSTPDGGAGQEL